MQSITFLGQQTKSMWHYLQENYSTSLIWINFSNIVTIRDEDSSNITGKKIELETLTPELHALIDYFWKRKFNQGSM